MLSAPLIEKPLSAHPSWRLDGDGPEAGLVHADAGTFPPERVSAYHVDFADIELARPLDWYEARVRAIRFDRGERVLDAACGVGQWSLAMARTNREVHGLDRAVERLAIAERLAAAHGVRNAHFSHGDLEELPFPDGWFDAVFCYGVLMFLEPARALGELARVLRPGGRLYVCANGPGWPLLLVFRRRLVRMGLQTLAKGLRGAPGGFLTRGRLARAGRRQGLELRSFAGEGTLREGGEDPEVEPAYPGRYAGLTCVFEALLERRQEAAGAPAPHASTGSALASELLSRAQDFDRPDRAVPAEVTEVDDAYALPRARELHGRHPPEEQERRLDALVAALTQDAGSDRERALRILRFVQDALYHHPLSQPPPELSPYEVLELGDARCGDVSRVAEDLLLRAGVPARRRQFTRHVIAEAFVDSEWRIFDADAFKNGVVPRGDDGALLTMRELAKNPYRIDRYPPTGWWVHSRSRHARNAAGEKVGGYVDAVGPEQRGYMSTFYVPSLPREHPPSIPELEAQPAARGPGRVKLAWRPATDPDGDLRGYRVRVGTSSRGWSYDDMDYSRLPAETGAELGQFEVSEPFVELDLERPGTYYWSVKAFDAHVDKEPETFYWSSDEGRFELS